MAGSDKSVDFDLEVQYGIFRDEAVKAGCLDLRKDEESKRWKEVWKIDLCKGVSGRCERDGGRAGVSMGFNILAPVKLLQGHCCCRWLCSIEVWREIWSTSGSMSTHRVWHSSSLQVPSALDYQLQY